MISSSICQIVNTWFLKDHVASRACRLWLLTKGYSSAPGGVEGSYCFGGGGGGGGVHTLARMYILVTAARDSIET